MKLHLETLGAVNIEIEAPDEKEAIRQLSFWQSLPDACPKCGAEIRFHFKSPQNNDYWLLYCLGQPRHESNLGVFREKEKGLFYKGDSSWEVAYGESIIEQRNREIAQYDEKPPQQKQNASANASDLPIQQRIEKAKEAIQKLGQHPFTAKENEPAQKYFERLTKQYNDAKAARQS